MFRLCLVSSARVWSCLVPVCSGVRGWSMVCFVPCVVCSPGVPVKLCLLAGPAYGSCPYSFLVPNMSRGPYWLVPYVSVLIWLVLVLSFFLICCLPIPAFLFLAVCLSSAVRRPSACRPTTTTTTTTTSTTTTTTTTWITALIVGYLIN